MSVTNFIHLLPMLITALWTGAAASIAFIEEKSRTRLDDKNKLIQWSDSFRIGLKVMALLGALSFLSGFLAFAKGGNNFHLYGAIDMLAVFPLTYLKLTPRYTKLLKSD